MDINPPQPDHNDILNSVSDAFISAFPFGSSILKISDIFSKNPEEMRVNKFFAELCYKINDHDKQLKFLNNNFLHQIIPIIRKREDKWEYLRNSLMNHVTRFNPKKEEVFLRFIDNLTVEHIQILKLFSDPKIFYEEKSIKFKGRSNLFQVIHQAFPETNEDWSNFILKELHNCQLLGIENHGGMMTEKGCWVKRTTLLGDEFLDFIMSCPISTTPIDSESNQY